MRLCLVLIFGGMAGWMLCSCATEGSNVRRESYVYSKYLTGLLCDRLGSIDEAVVAYKQAQHLDDRAPSLHLQLGLDYIQQKKFNEAVSEFEKAVRLSPDDDDARYVLALLYIQLNDFGKSAQQYEKLLEKNLKNRSENIQLRRILSQLYFLGKDYRAAEIHCKGILQWDPLDEEGLYWTAMVASEKGEFAKAIEGFKETLQAHPECADAMNSLAYLYAETDMQLDKALILAEKALEYDSSNGAYLDTLGWVYFKIGEFDKAFGFLERASKLLIDPVILDHLKQAKDQQKKLKQAP